MLESIAIKLLTVLAGYAFEATLESQESVNIEGAPGWYMKHEVGPTKDRIWVYAMQPGGPDTIEKVKSDLRDEMVRKIEEAIEIVLYDNFRDLTHPAEKAFVQEAAEDPHLPTFVKKHLTFHKLEHLTAKKQSLLTRKRQAASFGGAFLSRQALLDYQERRLRALAKRITLRRADQGHEELRGQEPGSNSPFSELPPSKLLQEKSPSPEGTAPVSP